MVICFIFASNVQAQKSFNKKNRYHSIGFNASAMNYVGELDPKPYVISPSALHTRYNIGATYLYRLKARTSFRMNMSYGRIAGDDYSSSGYETKDIHRKLRNLNFRNDIFELKADVVIDLFPNYNHFRKRRDYTPYFFTGIAYFHHNPQGQTADGRWVNLRPLSTEGQGLPGSTQKQYSLHQIAIPVGVGFRYKLSRHWDLAFEVGWRFTFTDYLDDVGGNFADKDHIRNHKGDMAAQMADRSNEAIQRDPILRDFVENHQGGYVNKDNSRYGGNGDRYIYSYNVPGAQRGDLNKDWYIVTGFHLTYILPDKVICPKFRD